MLTRKLHFDFFCRMSTNAKADFKQEHMLQTEVSNLFHHQSLMLLSLWLWLSLHAILQYCYHHLSHHNDFMILPKGDNLHGQWATRPASWGDFQHRRVVCPLRPWVHGFFQVTFHIQEGSFYNCIMPGVSNWSVHWKDLYSLFSKLPNESFTSENVESLWGPIPLPRLPPGVDNTCRAVTHG